MAQSLRALFLLLVPVLLLLLAVVDVGSWARYAGAPATTVARGGGREWWDTAPANTYGVLIPETRGTPAVMAALAWLVGNTLDKVPPTWSITVYHLPANGGAVRHALRAWVQLPGGRVRLQEQHTGDTLATDNTWANRVMLTPEWWQSVPYPKFLLMQTDSLICRRDDLDFLEEITHYDYAGAPWRGPPPFDVIGGNGGFSWRSKAAHLAVLRRAADAAAANASISGGLAAVITENEDTFFSRAIAANGSSLRMAPLAVNCRFAVETRWCNREPFGVHKAWHHSAVRWPAIAAVCPDGDISRRLW